MIKSQNKILQKSIIIYIILIIFIYNSLQNKINIIFIQTLFFFNYYFYFDLYLIKYYINIIYNNKL